MKRSIGMHDFIEPIIKRPILYIHPIYYTIDKSK